MANTGALTAVENKMSNVTNLIKKTDYDAKISDTTADYNNCTSQPLDVKIKQKELVDKSVISGFINNSDLDKKSSNISYKSRIKAGNIWKDFSADNIKKTEFYGYVYNFSVDYDAAAVDDILDISKYKITKLQAFDSSYFWGKSHFENDVTQNYLVFQPMYRHF